VDTDRLLTFEEVGAHLGISTRSARRLVETGAIERTNVSASETGIRMRVRRSAVQEFIASRTDIAPKAAS
jgi:excisionase family DNA binding protein